MPSDDTWEDKFADLILVVKWSNSCGVDQFIKSQKVPKLLTKGGRKKIGYLEYMSPIRRE